MAGSLRDQLTEVYDQVVPDGVIGGGSSTPAEDTSTTISAPAEPAQGALPLSEGKPRDPETGKFVKGEEKKDTKSPSQKAAPAVPSAAVVHKAGAVPGTPPKPQPQAVGTPPPAQAVTKARPPRPSSWKKEMWDAYEQLPPEVAEYIHTRESQFANGVSTYKAELDAHKPIIDAMQQFIPELQQYKVDPSRWITELGNVHRSLIFGNPQQKLQTLATVARAYGIPIEALYDQGAQQQFMQAGQMRPPYQPPQNPAQQPLTREEAQKMWQEQYLQTSSQQEIERFSADTEKHPHYEALRETMAQILDAGLAENLDSAYDKALRMNDDLWKQTQEQGRATEDAERQRVAQERVNKARGKAVSPASATPNGPGSEDKPKGLRSQLSEAFDAHAGGRV